MNRSPVFVVARKEARELVRDGRFRILALTLLTLLVLTAVAGHKSAQTTAREIADARAADRAAWLGQGPRNPHSAAHFGQYAFKSTPALSFADRGVDPYTGIAVWLEAHYQDPPSFRPAEDRTALARLGGLTAALVLELLVPLLLFLLAFSAIAGERERGTWRLALAQGARPRDLALGKLLGLGGPLLALLAPAALLGAIATSSGNGAASADQGARWLLFAGVHLLYFVALLGLGLTVSASSRSSRLALLLLAGFWVTNGLVLPRAAAEIAERLSPSPSATQFWDQISKDQKEGLDGHDSADARYQQLERETLARYGVSKLEELPVNFDGIALQAGEEHSNKVFDRRWGELWDTYERQERFQAALGVFAPFLSVRGLSMALAGTDLAAHRRFAASAEEHRRVINRQLNGHMTANAGKDGFDWKADPKFWQEVPEFVDAPPRLGEVLAAHRLELVLLSLWTVVALVFAVRSAERAAAF